MPSPKNLNRRQILTTGAVALGASALGFPAIATEPKREWKMALAWPKELPGLGTGAVRLANRITEMSGGRLTIKVYSGGELVPPLGIFDAVSEGTVQMGHCAAYYWLNKHKSAAFFCGVPGGFTPNEYNGWILFGGGQQLWDELYGQFGLKAFPAGNTGTQMGGWFKKEIRSLADIKGLKMRIPGLGGEVFSRLGGSAQTLPAQELFTALQTGVIDATEWVGPWNDLAMGFHRVADYYYGPGFQEGGPALELMVNKKEYDALPKDLQQLIKVACATETLVMESEFQAGNVLAYHSLTKEHGVKTRLYPEDVLKAFFKESQEVVAETASIDNLAKRIYDSYYAYWKTTKAMTPYMEYGFLKGRIL